MTGRVQAAAREGTASTFPAPPAASGRRVALSSGSGTSLTWFPPSPGQGASGQLWSSGDTAETTQAEVTGGAWQPASRRLARPKGLWSREQLPGVGEATGHRLPSSGRPFDPGTSRRRKATPAPSSRALCSAQPSAASFLPISWPDSLGLFLPPRVMSVLASPLLVSRLPGTLPGWPISHMPSTGPGSWGHWMTAVAGRMTQREK